MDVEENDHNSSDKSSSDSSDDDEAVTEELEETSEMQALRQTLKDNPYMYESHTQLISLLSNHPDLTKLREARENMAKYFPLTEQLWVEWFEDEMPLAIIPEQKQYLVTLFEKAVQDYLSVRVWVKYCQFMMDGIETADGIGKVRDVFERAITAVGVHVTDGSSVWSGYRELESSILQSYQQLQDAEDSADMESKIETQMERVNSLYKRQLMVPLLGIEDTLSEYEDWSSSPVADNTRAGYKRTVSKLKSIVEFEERLSKVEGAAKQGVYQEYIAYETTHGDPVRVQCLFERAIVDNCLDGNLWLQYMDYLTEKLKIKSVIMPVFERSVRNCPWVSKLWQQYIFTMGRFDYGKDDVAEVLNQSLTAGFNQEDDYLQILLVHLGYLKDRVTVFDDSDEHVELLLKQYEDDIAYMTQNFGDSSSSLFKLSMYYASVLDVHCKQHKRAVEIWEGLAKNFSKNASFWIRYTDALCAGRDILLCRRVFQRAIQISVDEPGRLTEAYLDFEVVEGTLEQVKIAKHRCSVLLGRSVKRQEKEQEKNAAEEKEQSEREERQKQNRSARRAEKRRSVKDSQSTIGGRPKSIVSKNSEPQKTVHRESGSSTKQQKVGSKRSMPQHVDEQDEREPASKQPKVDSKQPQDATEKETDDVDGQLFKKPDRQFCVFLSNLVYRTEEASIQKHFSTCGSIKDVTIVRSITGRSKGFAYLEFECQEAVEAALKLDRQFLDGRPVFVSPNDSKKRFEFKFPKSLDKFTVYVSSLPYKASEQDVEKVFSAAGEIKQIRLVTNRSGIPQGYGYVEFTKEADAAKAVLTLDGHELMGREIAVALSNPPVKHEATHDGPRDVPHHYPPPPPLPPGLRGKSKTLVSLVPRSVRKPPTASSEGEATSDDTSLPKNKMSNDDFRKLLGK